MIKHCEGCPQIIPDDDGNTKYKIEGIGCVVLYYGKNLFPCALVSGSGQHKH